MSEAVFQFIDELNFFLPYYRKAVSFTHYFNERTSVKDMIESLGVPHPEVNCILVNGKAVNFSYIVQDGDRIFVYPISADIQAEIYLQPPLPHPPCFILDVHLGKLASSLRMLGFDTLYQNNYEDEEIAQISATENRIVLTRDRGVLMRSLVIYGYYVRETIPERQIVEVLKHFNCFNAVNPFQRCMNCNGVLQPVDKQTIIDLLPSKVRDEISQFHRCRDCNQIYWRGSHYDKMLQMVEKVLSAKD